MKIFGFSAALPYFTIKPTQQTQPSKSLNQCIPVIKSQQGDLVGKKFVKTAVSGTTFWKVGPLLLSIIFGSTLPGVSGQRARYLQDDLEVSVEAYPQPGMAYTLAQPIAADFRSLAGFVHPGVYTLPYTEVDAYQDHSILSRQNPHKDINEMGQWFAERYSFILDGQSLQHPADRLFYEKTISSEFMVGRAKLAEMTAKELKNFLLDVHNSLAQYSIIQGDSGTWRSEKVLVFSDAVDGAEGFSRYLEEHDPKFLPAWNQFLPKFLAVDDASFDRDRLIKKLTPLEKELVENHLFIPLGVKAMKKQFDVFIKTLLKRLKSEEDPIQVAAYAHGEIARLHPFNDGNGRVARFLVNQILGQPVIFPNNKGYTEAIQAERLTPGAFSCYLEKRVRDRQQTTIKEIGSLEKTARDNRKHREKLQRVVKSIASGPSHQPCSEEEWDAFKERVRA